ncbi:MAG: leucine-rich repeat protein, partial [Romboutsia sp.]|nr:leucine-rich repeat protein [Romboutsia sp.]
MSLPNCYSLSNSAFGYCYSLKSINLPNITSKSIPYAAFYCCSSLSEVYFSNLYSTIGTYAFYSCSSLVNVSLPLCTQLGVTAFGYCYS